MIHGQTQIKSLVLFSILHCRTRCTLYWHAHRI